MKPTGKQLKAVIAKYDKDAQLIGFNEDNPFKLKQGGTYTIASPNSLDQCVIDYIACHFEIK